MIYFKQYRIEAIKNALEFVSKWKDINRLISNAHRFCNALDEDFEALLELRLQCANDECLKETIRVATSGFGANNLLSALYYINGNYIQSDIWYARYIHSTNRAFGLLDELNDMDD